MVKPNDETQQLSLELDAFESEIRNLQERNGVKVVRSPLKYTQRYMDFATTGLTMQTARYEYIASVLFVVAHELAHATYDRFNPVEHAAEWTEVRADLFAIVISEALTRQAEAKK